MEARSYVLNLMTAIERHPWLTEDRQVRRDAAPPGYTTPPFPSLHIPLQDPANSLYTVRDIWRFTLLWTLILFGLFHLGAAGLALLMQTGKTRVNWKYLGLVPLAYGIVAGAEALMAGSIVGLMSVSDAHPMDFFLQLLMPGTELGQAMLLGNSPCRLGYPLSGAGSIFWC